MNTIENKLTNNSIEPKYIDRQYLPKEALIDPDYRLKQLQNLYGKSYEISCSKCHHCR